MINISHCSIMENSFTALKSVLCLFIHSTLPLGNHWSFSVSTVLLFLECSKVGIICFVAFLDWFLPLSKRHVKFIHVFSLLDSIQFSSVAQSCPTLCNTMNCSTPGLPVHHQLQEFLKLMSIKSVMSSNHLVICHPLLLLPPTPPSIRGFSNQSTLRIGGQSIGLSALASVLPMNTQDWSPLEWTGWISLQSKRLSRVFSNTTVKSINSSALSFLHSPTLTSIHDNWKNHSFE